VVAACSSGPGGKSTEPTTGSATVVAVPADAAAVADAPEPPKLGCETGTAPLAAIAPDPTWACARPDGTRHGPFVTLFPDNTIEIAGSYKDDKLDGAWERHAPGGAVVERGGYVAGQKHGKWTQLSTKGIALGDYELANGTGVEKRWYDDGPLFSETTLKAGVLDGPRKEYLRDGTLIDGGKYRAGKLEGLHVFGTRNSLRIEENMTAGVRHGRRLVYHQGGLIADEAYDRYGRLDGPYVSWHSAKIARVKGQFSSGRRTGDWEWNDKDGKKEREGSYVSGRRTGIWQEWQQEKLTFSGTYDNGKPDGTFTYWKKDGSEIGHFDITGGTGVMIQYWSFGRPMIKQHVYKGVEDGPYYEYLPNGKVLVEGHYAGGIKHGSWKRWNGDGALVVEEKYKRGKVDGVVKKYVDGKLATESHFVDGKVEGAYAEYRLDKPAVTGQFTDDHRTGTWTYYNADGAVVRIATYKNGVLEGPYRELVANATYEGEMVAGRRTGTWTRTDKAGGIRKLAYRSP
jgi:antitoxin component YwqK of YwqJK toxin-antitoxin module